MKERILKTLRKRLNRIPIFRVKKDDNPIRWGIVGLGNMAEVFSTAIDGNKSGIVYAVASRNIEKAIAFGKKHNCNRAYGSYGEMLSDKTLNLDVVYIATPVKYHYDNIKQCLLAGKNVLCEKPICPNAIQFKELIALAKDNNCFLMEGMWMKCLPTFQKAKEWESRIGKKELVKVDFYKRELIRPELSIFNSEEEGGILKDYGVYALSFACSFLGGFPSTLTAHVRKSSFCIDSDWQIYFERDGVKAFVSLSSDFGSLSKASVVGTDGTIEWNSQFNRTNTITLYDKYGVKVDECKFDYHFDGFEYEVDEVQKCIRDKKKSSSIVPVEDALNTLRIIDNITESGNE